MRVSQQTWFGVLVLVAFLAGSSSPALAQGAPKKLTKKQRREQAWAQDKMAPPKYDAAGKKYAKPPVVTKEVYRVTLQTGQYHLLTFPFYLERKAPAVRDKSVCSTNWMPMHNLRLLGQKEGKTVVILRLWGVTDKSKPDELTQKAAPVVAVIVVTVTGKKAKMKPRELGGEANPHKLKLPSPISPSSSSNDDYKHIFMASRVSHSLDSHALGATTAVASAVVTVPRSKRPVSGYRITVLGEAVAVATVVDENVEGEPPPETTTTFEPPAPEVDLPTDPAEPGEVVLVTLPDDETETDPETPTEWDAICVSVSSSMPAPSDTAGEGIQEVVLPHPVVATGEGSGIATDAVIAVGDDLIGGDAESEEGISPPTISIEEEDGTPVADFDAQVILEPIDEGGAVVEGETCYLGGTLEVLDLEAFTGDGLAIVARDDRGEVLDSTEFSLDSGRVIAPAGLVMAPKLTWNKPVYAKGETAILSASLPDGHLQALEAMTMRLSRFPGLADSCVFNVTVTGPDGSSQVFPANESRELTYVADKDGPLVARAVVGVDRQALDSVVATLQKAQGEIADGMPQELRESFESLMNSRIAALRALVE